MPCSAPGGMFQQQEAPQNGPSSDGEGSGGGDIQVRENFDPLAACLGFARTGVDGSVRITFKTPDTMTKYRVYAFACTGTQFGQGMSMLTVRMDFSMRLTIPRFLHIGDMFNANITLLNFTKKFLEVDVITHCSNFEITGAARRCRIPPNDRADVEVPCHVLVEAASATISSAAFAHTVEEVPQELTDAVVLTLPVYLPVVPEEVVDAGILESGDAYVGQKVVRSDSMVVTYGHLRVQASRDPGVQLSGVVTSLWNYWMDCTEQLSSTIIALSYVHDQEGIIEGVSREEILKRIHDKLLSLKKRVCSEPFPGFCSWSSRESSPLSTLLGFHALVCALETLPDDTEAYRTAKNMYPHVIEGVRKLAAAGVWIEFPPPPVFRWWYTPVFEDSNVVKEPEEDTHQKLYLSAYGANLLLRLARHEGLTATDVVELSWEACKSQWKAIMEIEDFSPIDMDSVVHMLALSVEAISGLRSQIADREEGADVGSSETSSELAALKKSLLEEQQLLDELCQFIQSSFEDDGTYLRLSTPYVSSFVESVLIYTKVRTSAYLLTQLIFMGALRPNAEEHLLPETHGLLAGFHRLARGLLKARQGTGGVNYFFTTQENGIASEALSLYFRAFTGDARVSPLKFVYRGNLIQSKELGSGERCTALIPMEQLDMSPQSFFIHKPDGPPVFYEIGFRCARSVEKAVRMTRNFEVRRTFSPVYNVDDLCMVSEREIHVKMNALIVVNISVSNRSMKYHVSLVDRLAACFEFLDESLKGSEKIMHDHVLGHVDARATCHFQQRILKDHAILGYSMSLYPSTNHILRYVVRATNRGRFIMPATKVEEMYSPENYALDLPVVVVVE